MLLSGFPAGTDDGEVLHFIEQTVLEALGEITLATLRVDAQGRNTGIAEVHFGQKAWPEFFKHLHKSNFFGHEIVVLPSLNGHTRAMSVEPPISSPSSAPLPKHPAAAPAEVPPPRRDDAGETNVQHHNPTMESEDLPLPSVDGEGEPHVQHRLISQPDWWPYNNPRILLQLPYASQLRRTHMNGWESWEEMRADVNVRARMLEEAHTELHFRLRQLEIDIAILQANGVQASLPR